MRWQPGRARRRHRHDRCRAQHGRQGARGPRLLRGRQPARPSWSATWCVSSTRSRASASPSRPWSTSAPGSSSTRCAPSSPRSSRPGARRCSTSRPPTTSWSGARRPPGGRTRCRAPAGCSRASPRSASVIASLRGDADLVIDTTAAQRAPAQGEGRRGVRHPRDGEAADHRGQLRVQVRRPGRCRPDGRHAVPAEPPLGARAASPDRQGRRRRGVRQGPAGRPGVPRALPAGDRDGRRRLPAGGQAVHDRGDRLHRRQAPQRGDDRGDRRPAAPAGLEAEATHRDLGRE